MARPPEYENLIRLGAFAEVKPTAGAVEGFLAHAADYLGAAEALDIARPMQVFTMAYEGLYQVVQAVLEHYEVRTKDAVPGVNYPELSATTIVSGAVGR